MGARDLAAAAGECDLPEEVVADLLDSSRRCHLLAILEEHEAAVVADLAGLIRARETEAEPGSVPRSDRHAVRDDLFMTHIPKLTATGVVEYDSMVGRVSLAEPAVAALARQSLED